MGKSKGLKPGEKAPVSGQYQIIGPKDGKGAERTGVKGKTLPPTPTAGGTYRIKDKTKTK